MRHIAPAILCCVLAVTAPALAQGHQPPPSHPAPPASAPNAAVTALDSAKKLFVGDWEGLMKSDHGSGVLRLSVRYEGEWKLAMIFPPEAPLPDGAIDSFEFD